MRKLSSALIIGLTVVATQAAVDIAPTPPLGWNSFDSYGVYLHEKAALANLEAMAELLEPYGYEYFVIDNGWFGEYELKEGSLYPLEKHASDVRLNEYGYVLPSKTYFPNGLKPLIERCHELGLKFGLHMMRGIPRKAYDLDLPIKGTPYTARDIADLRPENNCTWCTYNFGVDMSKPGAQEWYDGLIQHLADMGVDMIKYDDIVPYPEEVEAVAEAIEKTGKPILLSLSPGRLADPDAIESFRKANMLRVTKDVWDEVHYIDECFIAWRKWAGKNSDNFWIDMDMIPFGQLLMMSPRKEMQDGASEETVRLAGHGYRRWQQLSQDQMFTFITMRALSASPLMVGGDLPTMDGFSLRLLTDPEMLACNQNGVMGHLIYEDAGIEAWKAPEKGEQNQGWIGVFNRTDCHRTIRLNQDLLDLSGQRVLYNVWNGRKQYHLGSDDDYKIDINPGGVLFLRYF